MVKVYSWARQPEAIGQKNSGESKVSMVGYVPTKKRIREMQLAGLNLLAFRAAEYDFEHPDQDDGHTIDRLRELGNDFEDIEALRDEYLAKFYAKQKAWLEREKTAAQRPKDEEHESIERNQTSQGVQQSIQPELNPQA